MKWNGCIDKLVFACRFVEYFARRPLQPPPPPPHLLLIFPHSCFGQRMLTFGSDELTHSHSPFPLFRNFIIFSLHTKHPEALAQVQKGAISPSLLPTVMWSLKYPLHIKLHEQLGRATLCGICVWRRRGGRQKALQLNAQLGPMWATAFTPVASQ